MSSNTSLAGTSARCIYTGEVLVPGDETLKPSHEHIVPLALGGSNQFTTNDVTAAANARAGNEIDDAAAALLPFLTLRHRYGLKGNRRTIPNVVLKGEFTDLSGAPATMEISPDAKISLMFQKEQTVSGEIASGGQLVSLGTTEERVRFFLRNRLQQASQRGGNIFTRFGQIRDEEDIEIALLLSEREQGKNFKASLTLDVAHYHFAFARLMLKIALGLGHRVLGPSWTFSSSGELLRQGLWATPDNDKLPPIHGSVVRMEDYPLARLLGIVPDKHVMAVLPGDSRTAAIIALFGGALGIATVDLGIDKSSFFMNFQDEASGGCVFEIPLDSEVSKRRLVCRTFRQLANGLAHAKL